MRRLISADQRQLQQRLDRLAAQTGPAIELGLDRISRVAQRLQVQPGRAKVVTVAGTNGKGSTVATIDALLRAHGWQVGRYMSPHLIDFRERACIDGQMLAAADWLEALDRVAAAQDGIHLTYFEVTTLAALWLFMQRKLDAWVLEVGLGGRLDAVNLIDADVAVITSIGIDHVEYLGATRDLIAREKAGILRPQRPCIIAETDPPASLRSEVARCGAFATWMGVDAWVQERSQDWDLCQAHQTWQHLPRPRLALANVATGLLATLTLLPELAPATVHRALQGVQLMGRMQVWEQDARVLLDVAHNPHGAAFLCRQLRAQPVPGKTWVVIGMLADKDRAATVAEFIGIADGFYPCTLAQPRGGAARELAGWIRAQGGRCQGLYATPQAALADCRTRAAAEDRILVVGSFHTVAAILAAD